jgi:hypothetical protein
VEVHRERLQVVLLRAATVGPAEHPQSPTVVLRNLLWLKVVAVVEVGLKQEAVELAVVQRIHLEQ